MILGDPPKKKKEKYKENNPDTKKGKGGEKGIMRKGTSDLEGWEKRREISSRIETRSFNDRIVQKKKRQKSNHV